MKKNQVKNNESKKNKEFLVMSAKLENYKLFDVRANKPFTYISKSNDQIEGEMVLQEIDTLKISSNTKEKIEVEYFSPNNVGILLSISQKNFEESKQILKDYLLKKENEIDNDKRKKIIDDSVQIYNYIEKIQSCIVFGYTALEAFANLSIPDEYQYKNINNKGIVEVYNKDAIERWLNLGTKIDNILVDIYDTKPIKGSNLWNRLNQFEELRNSIIHQKTINSTNFYKDYFYKNIGNLCETPIDVIKFFFDERKDKETTNPLWPWLINEKNDFPISYDYDSQKFEVTGNLWDGRKKEKNK